MLKEILQVEWKWYQVELWVCTMEYTALKIVNACVNAKYCYYEIVYKIVG